MNKFSVIYSERRTFGKYDANNIIGYLDEEQVPDYLPEGSDEPATGYRYTGTERDGGTIMPCRDPGSYPEVANAIIRSRYSESEEMAIHRHHLGGSGEYAGEWQQYNDFCESAKALAKDWLGMV